MTPDSAPAEAAPGHWYIPGPSGGFLSSRGATAFELLLVTLIALAVLVPGIWSYSLVDPWETHYGEVARRMLQDHDWVHTTWSNEGFRSKPVLTFWLMAASMKAMGIASNGGYSGELVASEWVMFAIRLPFALFGAMGLVLTWWMLARQVSRRVAWLALLVIGTTPFYFFVARQGITDMTMVSCLIGTMACFVMALHAGDEPVLRVWRRVNAFHIYLAALLLLVGWQIVYYGYFFARYPGLGGGVRVWHPEILLPGAMLVGLAGFLVWSIFLQPTRSMRQVYMYWAWTLLGVSVLGKGLAALGLSLAIGGLYILVTWNWRLVIDLELARGFYLVILIAIPWHFGMWMKEGRGFIQEYVIQHNLNRAASGVHGDRGTFDYYLSQVGIGMWPWVALLPAAIARTVTVATSKVREHRVRFVIGIWAIAAVAMFVIVQTKFHHYILPAVPAMAILIAFWIDDLWAGRVGRTGLVAFAGVAIVLLVMRDLIGEEKQFIELFVYRYDRPWPSMPPWKIDVSDGFLGFGVAFAVAVALVGFKATRRWSIFALGAAAAGFAAWAMYVYMPIAATHWGMREAAQTYYQKRDVHGIDITYYKLGQIAAEWEPWLDKGTGRDYEIQSFLPETIALEQEKVVRVGLASPDGKTMDRTVEMHGPVVRLGDNRFTVRLSQAELARLEPLIREGHGMPEGPKPPWLAVDADRLIAWQLYWRGENFWSADEIWGRTDDRKTAFKQTDNVEFLKYLNTPGCVGQRFFVLTESGRATSLKGILPTARAKETFEILDTTSNKFSLLSFVL